MHEVEACEAGYNRLLHKLEKLGYKLEGVIPVNDFRYVIAIGKLYGNQHNILMTYKREPFFSFGVMFKHLGAKGSGDTINYEQLKYAVQKDVQEIFLIFPNGSAYSIQMLEFLTDCIHWKNREGKEVRSIALSKYKFQFKI